MKEDKKTEESRRHWDSIYRQSRLEDLPWEQEAPSEELVALIDRLKEFSYFANGVEHFFLSVIMGKLVLSCMNCRYKRNKDPSTSLRVTAWVMSF